MDDDRRTARLPMLIVGLGATTWLATLAACGDTKGTPLADDTQGAPAPAVGTAVALGSAGTTAVDASLDPPTTREGAVETTTAAPVRRIELSFVTQPPPRGESEGESEGRPSDAELAAIVRKSLEFALVEQQIPDHSLLVDPHNVVLSTENIDAGVVSDLPGVHLVLRTPDEIQASADVGGDYLYLHFQPLEVGSADEVLVRLDNTWAVDRTDATPMLYLSGGGIEVRFVREPDGWVGYLMYQWIS